jgi:hypothetical protein
MMPFRTLAELFKGTIRTLPSSIGMKEIRSLGPTWRKSLIDFGIVVWPFELRTEIAISASKFLPKNKDLYTKVRIAGYAGGVKRSRDSEELLVGLIGWKRPCSCGVLVFV